MRRCKAFTFRNLVNLSVLGPAVPSLRRWDEIWRRGVERQSTSSRQISHPSVQRVAPKNLKMPQQISK